MFPDAGLPRKIEAAHQAATAFLARGDAVEAELARETITVSDRDHSMAITVNGLGVLTALNLPTRSDISGAELGRRVTDLLDQARTEADELYTVEMRRRVPGWSKVPDIHDTLHLQDRPVDFHRIDYIESWKGRNAVAEALETQYEVVMEVARLSRREVIVSIGQGMGEVSCDLNADALRVDLVPAVTLRIGGRELADLIANAIQQVEKLAEQERSTTLTAIARSRFKNQLYLDDL